MGKQGNNIPLAVQKAMLSTGSKGALNVRHTDGVWHSISASEFVDLTNAFARSLIMHGLQKGDTVGLIAPSSPYWLIVDSAIQRAGGITVPIFDNICSEHLAFQIKDSAMKFAFSDGPEAWTKLSAHSTTLKHTIVRNAHFDTDDHTSSYDSFIDHGRSSRTHLPQTINSNSLATIIYTSGSTGTPKGVPLTHANLLSQIEGAGNRFPLDPQKDKALSCLPLAHVFERMVVYFYLCSGIDLYFVDEIANVGNCLREVQPTTMTMVPRLLEKLYGTLVEKAAETPFPRKQIAAFAIQRAGQQAINRTPKSIDSLLNKLVYRKFQEGLGGKLQRVIVGGAPLAPRLQRFFINIGLPIYVGYGMTEASPVLSVNYTGYNKIGLVGPSFPKVTLKIGSDNEILAKGPNVMKGYHNNPEATARAIDQDGWLHTGDLGHIDKEGFLSIDGRKKELLKTSNGKYVTPIPMEQSLCQSPLVDIAMVIADGKPFVTCLLFLDLVYLEKLKAKRGRHFDSLEDFANSRTIKFLIQGCIEKSNKNFDHWERIRNHHIILEPPTIEAGEITPTMKLKRNTIEKKYHHPIESLYTGHQNIPFERRETPA